MNGKLIVWIIVTVCTITVVGMLMYTFADCGTPMETPSLKWRFEATDSGMYFNEYVKGELNRKFGPVPEYKIIDNNPCGVVTLGRMGPFESISTENAITIGGPGSPVGTSIPCESTRIGGRY